MQALMRLLVILGLHEIPGCSLSPTLLRFTSQPPSPLSPHKNPSTTPTPPRLLCLTTPPPPRIHDTALAKQFLGRKSGAELLKLISVNKQVEGFEAIEIIFFLKIIRPKISRKPDF